MASLSSRQAGTSSGSPPRAMVRPGMTNEIRARTGSVPAVFDITPPYIEPPDLSLRDRPPKGVKQTRERPVVCLGEASSYVARQRLSASNSGSDQPQAFLDAQMHVHALHGRAAGA